MLIAHLSDLHVGAHQPDVEESLVGDVLAATPDLTVVTGDLTMRARRSQFEVVHAVLERLPRPQLVVLGNHDVPLFSPSRIWAPYARYRRQITDDLDPAVAVAGGRALGLNSMPRWRWKSGRVSRRAGPPGGAGGRGARRRASLVRAGWDERDRHEVRVVALHHPASARGAARIAGRQRLLRAA